MDDVGNGVQTPHVVFVGKLHHCLRLYVVVDGRRLMVSNTFKEAEFLTFAYYYILWLEYPFLCKDAYMFLQITVFALDDNVTEKAISVHRFINKLPPVTNKCSQIQLYFR